MLIELWFVAQVLEGLIMISLTDSCFPHSILSKLLWSPVCAWKLNKLALGIMHVSTRLEHFNFGEGNIV